MPTYLFRTAIIFLFLYSCSKTSHKLKFIIDGEKVNDNSVFYNHVVSLNTSDTKKPFCSGVIIDDSYVLSASHCLSFKTTEDIVIGFWSKAESSVSNFRKVKKFHYYKESIKSSEFPNFDITVIELQNNIPEGMSKVTLGSKAYTAQKLEILGFGKTATNCLSCSGQLRKATVKIDKIISGPRYKGLLRVIGLNGSACMGDSGGPAFFQREDQIELIGITAGVHKIFNKAVEEDPEHVCESKESLYSSVVHYRPWIESVIKKGKVEKEITKTPHLDESFTHWCLYSRADKHWQTTQRILDVLSLSLNSKERLRLYEDCFFAQEVLNNHIEKSATFSFPRQTQKFNSLAALPSLKAQNLEFYFLDFGNVDFSYLDKIKRIDIVSSSISSASFCSLAKMQSLRDLRLSYIKESLVDLSCFDEEKIEHLEISYSQVLDITKLRRFKELDHLEVYGIKRPSWIDELAWIEKIIWEEE